ncbi:unnamed protein product [Rotaria socialis]|uniref:Reverse transcriptase domain-containing protein n=1 Tax=Rotaria socialis TaxID=392032 RepID=A0A818TBX0_9BILA|nr:unnamed protein product [Rotaria socialis]
MLHRRHDIPENALKIKQFSNNLITMFNDRYTSLLSYLDTYRSRNEMILVHSIKRKLRQTSNIIRVTDKSRVFHVDSTIHYEEKVKQYQIKTNACVELSSNPLMDTFNKAVRLFNDLRAKEKIPEWQYKKMMPKKDEIKLAYLYFIPKSHKEGTPLRPIVSGIYAPATGISKMLDKLKRPLFDQYVKQTTIIDGVHLIRQLHKYVSLDLLKPSTYLCTFDITDLYTMLPQEEAIAILKTFLLQFGHTHVRHMTIDAIESLARIVLIENVFTYNDKYYRQIEGGTMGSPFTLTLANIFMWHWEQKLVEKQKSFNELYGRYIDDISMTSNDSVEYLRQMLSTANEYHTNIKLTSEIGKSLSFLDVQIENRNGQLIPSKIYSTSIRKPIFETFHQTTSFSQMIHDENKYLTVRGGLLLKATPGEHARAARIATEIDRNKSTTCIDPSVNYN